MGKFNDTLSKYRTEKNLIIIFIISFAILGMLRPSQFLTLSNISSMAYQMPEFGIFTLGMMAIIMTGGINLSIVTTGTFIAIISALIMTSEFAVNSPILGIIVGLIVMIVMAIVTGCLNGAFVAYIGVPALLGTLGTSSLFQGIGLNVTKGGAISGLPSQFMAIGNNDILGIPIPMIIYIVVIIFSHYFLMRSVFGVHLHMVGSNPRASEFSGIDIKKVIMKAFIYSAFMSALAGMVMTARYNSAKVDYGSSYMMQAVTAAVLGGTDISGGTGSVAGVVIAVAIIQVVTTGLNIIGLDRNLVDISIGLILIVVLTLRHFSEVSKNKKLIEKRRASS
ncbi:MAG: ABC transporter permease [Clostridiaceae bacterium]|nr:ABC transporter permease [Clostridiaceae bacterium]